MAYVRDILAYVCERCGRAKATKEVINRFNSLMGRYCTKCAAAKLKEVQANEDKS